MCIHVQRNGPVSRMRELCLSIPEDKRSLFGALIQLFSQVSQPYLVYTMLHIYTLPYLFRLSNILTRITLMFQP